MITLYGTHFSIIDVINVLTNCVVKIKDDISFKVATTGTEYAIATLERDINMVRELNDIKYIELIKNIDLDQIYDNILNDRERIEKICNDLKKVNDFEHNKLFKSTDRLLDAFMDLEMAYSRLEDLIIEDKYKRAS